MFRGDVPLDAQATSSATWSTLPLHDIEERAAFQLRWETDHLTAYVKVEDASIDSTDAVVLVHGDATTTVSGTGA
ncbi:hypothetical protein NKG05_11550 [Oerskovia sp. M15]